MKVCVKGVARALSGVLLAGAATVRAGEYETRVVARDLARPVGIAIQGSGTIYFTQIPTPGVAGGENSVSKLQLESGQITPLSVGEPEPVNLEFERGTLYWTCKSAGVILQQREGGSTSLFLGGLEQPNGISVLGRRVFFTRLPTPGVPGSMGGRNTVNVTDGQAIHVLTLGEPEPTDIVVGRDGDQYWTCKTANVILKRTPAGEVSLLLGGLNKPVGIALDHKGEKLYFTEVPTPGVPGSRGGSNAVKELDLETGELSIVNFGDPEPTDVAVAKNGNVYWTCTSAGVIVEAKEIQGGRGR